MIQVGGSAANPEKRSMSIQELWGKGYLLWFLSNENPARPQNGWELWLIYTILIGGLLLFAILIPYLLGSINSAVLLSRILYRDDIRNHGSGNAGTTNMLRTYGKAAALFTLLGDVCKTLLAVSIASFLMSVYTGGWVAGLFCMLGHIFPIYYRFRGGKGVLCAAAAIALLSPFAFLCALLLFIAIVAMTKYVSLGSIVAAFMLPLLINFENTMLERGGLNGPVSVLMALLVIWCHRSNIRRIQNRTESKISFRKKATAANDASAKDGEQE